MSKRKSRKTEEVPMESLLKPFDITKFGSDEDPCFGKLYKPSATECGICGDSVICSIAMQQTQKARRDYEEQTNSFKDMEEVESFDYDLKKIQRGILSKLLKYNKPLGVTRIIDRIYNRHMHMKGATKEGAKIAVIKAIKQSNSMSTFKKGKIRYVKLK